MSEPHISNPRMPESIVTTNAPSAIGPYSQAIICREPSQFLFVSGQLAIAPGASALNAALGPVEQSNLALSNALAIVRAAGGVPEHVVKATLFLTDLRNYELVNETYAKAFAPWHPARSVVQVAALPRGALVEVELIAVLPLVSALDSAHAKGVNSEASGQPAGTLLSVNPEGGE